MKVNMKFIIGILLLLILAIGAVSASEDISDVAIAAEPSDDIISDQIDDSLEETDSQEEILEEDGEVKNFTELKGTLENAQGDVSLENDYKASPGDNERIPEIRNTCVIDGKGHTIDGDGSGFAIQIYGDDITVKNLIFRNIVDNNGTRDYSLFYVNGEGLKIENCTFENITFVGNNGPVIRQKQPDFILSNCTFKDIDAVEFIRFQLEGVDDGVADTQINDCNFINNNASNFITTYGYAFKNIQLDNCTFEGNNATITFININGDNSKINNCIFKENIGDGYITAQKGSSSQMHNCTFENNIAHNSDSADRFPISAFEGSGSNVDINVTNTTFINNRGIPIEWGAPNGKVIGCVFEGNNGTIKIVDGNVYRDNGKYDFEVIVYNDTVIGGSDNPYGSGGYVPLDPVGPGGLTPIDDEEDNLFVKFINNGPKEGNIVILLNGTECYNKPMTERPTSIYLDDLDPVKAGELNVVVKYVFAEDEYVLYDDTTFIGYNIGVVNSYVLEDGVSPHGAVTLGITLPKDATGTLIFSDGNQNCTIEYADGQAIYTLKGSDYKEIGPHSFSISLVNDPNYPEKSSAYDFSINPKVEAPVIIAEGEIDYMIYDFPDDFEGNILIYDVAVVDGDWVKGELLLNKSVKGYGFIPLPANLTPDEGYVHLFIEAPYIDSDEPAHILYIKNNESFSSSIESNTIEPGEDAVISVSCPVSGCGLFVLIDSNSPPMYEPTMLNDTTFTQHIPNLSLGEHKIKIIILSEDGPAYSNTFMVTVKEKTTPTPSPTPTPTPTVPAKIVAKNYSAYYNKGTYSVTVYGTDGKVAKGVTVVFKINGKKVKTVKTNSKGVAKFKIPIKYAPKTYKVSATALGKTVTKKLVVKQVLKLKKVTVKRSAKKLVITATLKEGKKALKGKKITFIFKGKKYTKKTNKKGIAKLTIKSKVLKKLKKGKKITYKATYLKDTVKRTVRVKK